MSYQNVGYFRVSSLDQSLDRQRELMKGINLHRIFEEKASAKDSKRPELHRCIDHVREDDFLHIYSIDRLARNLRDLQDIISTLNKKGVTVKFHKENLSFSGKDDPMSKLTLQMMGAFAEFERELIKERQREGIAAARAKGKQFGRRPALDKEQKDDLIKLVDSGGEKKAIAKQFGISRTTLYKVLNEKHS